MINPLKGYAAPTVDYVDTAEIIPQNGFFIDPSTSDIKPSVEASGASLISDTYSLGSSSKYVAYKINSENASLRVVYDYVGTYLGTRIGCEVTFTDFVLNNKVNTTSPVGQNSWENQHPNNPPAGYMPAVIFPYLLTSSWITKAVDSVLLTLKFFSTETKEYVQLHSDSAYISVSDLDNDCGGYEGVQPGNNCVKVICANDAFINHGTLRSDDGTYEDAFWGTLNLSENGSIFSDSNDRARRTGVTMFFEGDAITYRIIDTVGMIWFGMRFSPLFIEQPDNPYKSYLIES